MGKISRKRLRQFIASIKRRAFGKPQNSSIFVDQAMKKATWQSVLTGELEKECSAKTFLEVVEVLRREQKLSEAEELCHRGTLRHPTDLPLAVVHAEIATARKDTHGRLQRWRRVLEIGGKRTPLSAFKELADSQRLLGFIDQSEATLQQGLLHFSDDYVLTERLARIDASKGLHAKSIEKWEMLIRKYPKRNLAPLYLRMVQAYRAEGLFHRAAEVILRALTQYPEDAPLQQAQAELAHPQSSAKPTTICSTDESWEWIAHLFGGNKTPFGRGVVSFPFKITGRNEHIPAMLDFAECLASFQEPSLANQVDVFTVWGSSSGEAHLLARELARSANKPLLSLYDGLIGTLPCPHGDASLHSIIICPDSIYFDATHPSVIERRLNGDSDLLSEAQIGRAKQCMRALVQHQITRFNHFDDDGRCISLPPGKGRRLLLIDQCLDDPMINAGLGGELSFKRMLDEALASPDHRILLKLPPETIEDGRASYLSCLLPHPLPPNIRLVDFHVNPYRLFQEVDEVFVCTSDTGFEALLADKQVHCFAAPFYAGWGLTQDRIAIPRRKRHRQLVELFHLLYIEYARYFLPGKGISNLEDFIASISETKALQGAALPVTLPPPLSSNSLRILIVLPSGRSGATGRYVQTLALSLRSLDCEVLILADDKWSGNDCGVPWLSLDFEGMRLTSSLREKIQSFAPNLIYHNGVRTRAQRASLEALILTGAHFAMQSEDDELLIFEKHHGKAAAEWLPSIDQPRLRVDAISRYFETHNWQHSLEVLLNPGFDRWVEPLLRMLCYRLASLQTAIWYPFEQRLARDFGVPTLVVPPVASAADFERIPFTDEERQEALSRYGIRPESVVFFIGGALYSYSPEYAIFLEALNIVSQTSSRPMTLVVASGRSALPLTRMAKERLHETIGFADIGKADDETYMAMLKACDVVCSPGTPDSFNLYRLPSRLVKAMAMAKPVLTCKCGFGESLTHGINALVTEGADATAWADSISLAMDLETRLRIGSAGQQFAREHFDTAKVAAKLKAAFLSILSTPPRSLADGILGGSSAQSSKATALANRSRKSKFENHHHSPLRDAISFLATQEDSLETVVHLGTAKGNEIYDYCRLGANRILLIENSVEPVVKCDELTNHSGKIMIQQAFPHENLHVKLEQTCANIHLASGNHLLALEIDETTTKTLAFTSSELLEKFHWIALTQDSAEHLPIPTGFERVSLPANFTDLKPAALFRRLKHSPSLS